MTIDTRETVRLRRKTAVHEAGHILAAREVGVLQAWGYIEPDHRMPGLWRGMAHCCDDCLPLRDQRFICVAGAVAAYCDFTHLDEPPDLDDLCYGMTPSDRTIGDGSVFDLTCSTWREERKWENAALRAHKLFNPVNGRLWPALCREARSLIVTGRKYATEKAT
jgi:hypothetical protein